MKCRHCAAALSLCMADLGASPPSNSYLSADQLNRPETWYPLQVFVCTQCWLAQTADFVGREECFSANYAYQSSISNTWIEHARSYVQMVVERFRLNSSSLVVEVASNDGYLLKHVLAAGIRCYGIEPTNSTAAIARASGIEVIEEFFGQALSGKLRREKDGVDLMIANNVLAHVPDINDFVQGFTTLLSETGVATFEFPHLLNLLQHNQFDTIYHEHFSYLSLSAVSRIFAANGLAIFDVEEIPTHGGSLRVYAQRMDIASLPVNEHVEELLQRELNVGINTPGFYTNFQQRIELLKNQFVEFLIQAKKEGKRVAAYGAAAKGNTLINYAGVRSDLIEFVADRNPFKQGKRLPGSRIPIVDEATLEEKNPDYILILPWNLQKEVMSQLSYLQKRGSKFVVAVPELKIA